MHSIRYGSLALAATVGLALCATSAFAHGQSTTLYNTQSGTFNDTCWAIQGTCEHAVGLGDVDDDGVADFALVPGFLSERLGIGCGNPPAPPMPGFGVVSGATGTVLWSLPFFEEVFGVGDVTGNGRDDVGMLRNDGSGAGRRIELRDGSTGVLLREQPLAVDESGGAAGDTNGDGYGDIWVARLGEVRVFSGRNLLLIRLVRGSVGDEFGRAVAAAGDVDRNGADDLVISAPRAEGTGVVYVHAGEGPGLIREIRQINSRPGQFGIGLSGVGDLDDDGFDDVCAWDGAESWIYSGADGGVLFSATNVDSPLVAAGDVDGDGKVDLLHRDVIALGTDEPWSLLSGADGSTFSMIPGRFGVLAPVGDVNGDGFADLLTFSRSTRPSLAPPAQFDVSVVTLGLTGRPGRIWDRGVDCPGARGERRRIDYRGRAQLDENLSVRLRGGRPNFVALLHIGDPTTMPLDMIGAAGCILYSAPYYTVGAATNSLGFAVSNLALPSGVAPMGQRIDLQWVQWDPGANQLGVTVSDGLVLEVGAPQ